MDLNAAWENDKVYETDSMNNQTPAAMKKVLYKVTSIYNLCD